MAEFASWVAHFTQNRLAHEAQVFGFDGRCALPSDIRAPLVASVQRFQLGESGDGAQLLSKAGGGDYGAAAEFFVAEEQRHAELLLGLLDYLGAEPISGHWTDTVFVRVRRLLGLRTELMVLTVAEVIALSYYGALTRFPDPVVAAVATAVLADEQGHVRFHLDRLSPMPWPAVPLWWVILIGTTAVVAADHRRLLLGLGYPPHHFLRDVLADFAGVVRAVRAPRPT